MTDEPAPKRGKAGPRGAKGEAGPVGPAGPAAESSVSRQEWTDAAVERNASRSDVASLATEVSNLGVAVAELNDLIMQTMVKSEDAEHQARLNPSKRLLYGLVIAVAVLAFALAGVGAYVVHLNQSEAYQACLDRNKAEQSSQSQLGRLNQAIIKGQRQGDLFAVDLGKLLAPHQPPLVLPDCRKVKPLF